MTPADRREAALALAMLPVGGALLVIFALATPVLVAVAIGFATGGDWPLALWCWAAAVAAVWNAVRAIEVMSAFDWRPLPALLARCAAVAAAWPGWW